MAASLGLACRRCLLLQSFCGRKTKAAFVRILPQLTIQRGLKLQNGPLCHGEYEWQDPKSEDEIVNITYVDKNGKSTAVKGKVGDNVMYLAHRYNIEVEGACEASLACSTCHVYVKDEYFDKLPDPQEELSIMVFFTCNVCNESLKKNQVEKHYTQQCRRCEFLSCVDCGKEFWGDTYQTHIKCISEEEKYSGKNYVAKVNKGEVKQEQWIQKVQAAIQKAPSNPQLKNLLHKLEEFPNVPRKKAKFENFLKCSLRVFNTGLVNQVWELLMTEAQQQKQQQNGNNDDSNSKTEAEQTTNGNEPKESNGLDQDSEQTEKTLNKRERKEERRKKAHKSERKDKAGENEAADEGKSKKKGKRKKQEEDEEDENEAEEEVAQPKKKKRKGDTSEDNGTAIENGSVSHNDSLVVEEKKGKFDWAATIIAVLQSKGEISVKKLKKKVLAEYATYGGSKGEEKAEARFTKKLHKIPHVKVLKDKARLVES